MAKIPPNLYTVTVNCSGCGQKMAAIVAPRGHEDHAHVRCETCSPEWWCGCLFVEITRESPDE